MEEISHMNNQPNVELFTDGACSGNPGPGGWGCVLRYGQHDKDLNGYEPDTTNNRMEITAVLEGLRALKKPCTVLVTTDSKYVLQGATEWMKNWKKNGWKDSKKKPVKNQDLWQALDDELSKHKVTWQWVKGHAGHPENERADELATSAIKENAAK